MLAIPSFRRLWLVTALASSGDWLSLLALSALATGLTDGTQAQSFALGGVVATRLLPPLLFGPIAGVLADRFDRRKVMVTCDVVRFGLFFSIPLVGSLWWLFAATFMIEICSMFWIPAKDASVPNLLKRPDQVETANQLSLAMTYGVSVVLAAGLFSTVSTVGRLLGDEPSNMTTVYIALMINGAGYLITAATVWYRIPEISGRSPIRSNESSPSMLALLHDGARFVSSTPLIRGLVTGIIGAFVAGGAVIALAKLYATNLGGGDAAYGMLFVSVFIGMAAGMSAMPGLARKLPHNRLFGAAIVGAGLCLVLVAFAPHLFIALATVAMVGCCAGVAFLTGLTIIGAQVANEVRGRVVAFVQTIVRLDLLASMSVAPVAVGLVQTRAITVFDHTLHVDGSRTVLGVAGLIASLVGVFAYRQMDDRSAAPLLPDLLGALRRGVRRPVGGVLIAVEGATAAESARQSRLLADWLREQGYPVSEPIDYDVRLTSALLGKELTGERARALAAAAVHADVVEREVRPALSAGNIVVVDRFLASPLVHQQLHADELESLAVWANGGLHPDVTVLLDRAPAPSPVGEPHLWINRLLTRRAAAEPNKYLVVDADELPEVVQERVREGIQELLRKVRRSTPLRQV
ncbi:bifunctional MFS transporter/dTMP kinase [Pseudonocardia spinosispora]|uniref:bifunctional MFS transporter/dTMP kinase n=1 Tax=Pseudonocardia spinosispora TaxID=103441 RepID=UPI00040706A3|nr:MFS transporter [Pseudonocardia spinosispora]